MNIKAKLIAGQFRKLEDVVHGNAHDTGTTLQSFLAELDCLLRSHNELRSALIRYGGHHKTCPEHRTGNPEDCACGWGEIIAALMT